EITESAIKEALKNPRKIDMGLVNAQTARRVLDRIVGYKLSPFLWKKVARGLSAGRVQSVAVRLIVEREREIEKFIKQEYWSITALLNKKDGVKNEFEAILIEKDSKKIPKLGIENKKEVDAIVKDLEGTEYQVASIDKKETKKHPLPPFTTSTLQQTAGRWLGFTSKRTMMLAQSLYERGLITYHRTDSLNLSAQAISSAKSHINKKYGKNYYFFRTFKTKSKGAQEAHEAIRPTQLEINPHFKNASEEKLYHLIFNRFLASQMATALFDATNIKIKAKDYIFQANGQILKFDGFLKIYPMKFQEAELPSVEENEKLELKKLIPEQHFTQPPARYNEPSLIKVLEEYGIGRPSTYAPTISTIQARNYVQKNEQKRFAPTEIGIVVSDILVKHFPNIVDIKFTAEMETTLDEIAEGKEKWQEVIGDFYEPFEQNLKQKEQELSKQEIAEEETDRICPKCSSPLIIKLGRFGKFYACTGFPKCRFTESLKDNKLNIKCPKCKTGEVTEKRTKKGKIFYGCDTYPKCDFAVWDKPTGELCLKCKWLLIKTKRGQTKCSNPDCADGLKIKKKEVK
ncbi:type I DNA topoisomerase, partial [Patescibacteria group bacterium]|nr:type I DNA topoisomerase [Patescibacteria group bacterium]